MQTNRRAPCREINIEQNVCPNEKNPPSSGFKFFILHSGFFLQKKPHPCRVRHDPLNMFYNMRNPPGCFRLPIKACRPQSQIGSIDRFTTVQGFAANHEQGRANLVKLSKEQRAVSSLTRFDYLIITSSRTDLFSRKKFWKNYHRTLDKRRKRFLKTLLRFAGNVLAGRSGLSCRFRMGRNGPVTIAGRWR